MNMINYIININILMKLFILDDIEWPDENEWPIQPEAKNIISSLLQQNPRDRLGTGGSHEVKDHPYFYGVDWNSLLRQKAEFMPQLGNEEDTSYFDCEYCTYNMYLVINKYNMIILYLYENKIF